LLQTKEICSMTWAAKTKALTLSLAVLLGSLTAAEAEMSRTHVDFAGWSGTAIDGEIVGREFDRYELNAVAGDIADGASALAEHGHLFQRLRPRSGTR
jgi:hypothetical protein